MRLLTYIVHCEQYHRLTTPLGGQRQVRMQSHRRCHELDAIRLGELASPNGARSDLSHCATQRELEHFRITRLGDGDSEGLRGVLGRFDGHRDRDKYKRRAQYRVQHFEFSFCVVEQGAQKTAVEARRNKEITLHAFPKGQVRQ